MGGNGKYQHNATLTMGNITPKVLPDDDMPSGPMPSVKLLLDLRSNVLLDVVLFESCGGDIDGLLLHLLVHVHVLDDCLWSIFAIGRVEALGGGLVDLVIGHCGGCGRRRTMCMGWWWW